MRAADFRRTGPEQHARLVGRIFHSLSEGGGHLPAPWFAEEIARLDNVQGDVETIADRIAAARTWAYIAQRADWLADPLHWRARASEVEERLSDALHERLTQRFVDRRTSVLMRDLGRRGVEQLPVRVEDDGAVSVDGEAIGRLEGFRFVPDAAARHDDMKRLMAAAERRLGGEYARRAAALIADPDIAFALATDAGRPVAIFWRGDVVARLQRGRAPLHPRIALHRTLDALTPADRDEVASRLRAWLDGAIADRLRPWARIAAAAADPASAPGLRALLAPLAEAGAILPRAALDPALAALDRDRRREAVRLGLTVGALDLFAGALLKPEPMRWRQALLAAHADRPMPALPDSGVGMIDRPAAALRESFAAAGYRSLGEQMLRVDLVERLSAQAHDARGPGRTASPDPALAVSLGLRPPAIARLMHALGFRPAAVDGAWQWRGRRAVPAPAASARAGNAFGALAALIAADR